MRRSRASRWKGLSTLSRATIASGPRGSRRRRHPLFYEALEPRRLLSTFTVTKLTDTADGACDTDCSLREAVIAANANPGADTIDFALNGTFGLIIGGEDDTAAAGDLDLTDDVTISGAGAADTIIDANRMDRVFQVLPGVNAYFSQVMITRGRQRSGGDGAGIYNAGTLTLAHSTVSLNETNQNGGGIYNAHGTVT
jgi:CSLREA domain-containing protein